MASPQTNSLRLNRTLLVIFGITLASVMGTSSIAPAFPQFKAHFDVSGSQIGLLISFFAVPGIFLAPLTGWLADKYGRKEVIIPSLLLFGISGGLAFFSTSFSMLLTLRFCQGVGVSSLSAMNNTLLGDTYSGVKRTKAMGYNSSVLSVGTAIYPALGGALALLGWNFPFLLPLLAIPMAGIVALYIKNPDTKQAIPGRKEYFKGLKQSTGKQILLVYFAVFMAFILFYGSYLTYFPFLMEDRFQMGSGTIGVLMAVMSIGSALTSFQIGRVSEHIDLKKILQYAFLLYGIALILIIISHSLVLVVLSVLLLGVAQGACLPGTSSILADYAPQELRGMHMSIRTMFIRLGQTLGPLLMGWVFVQFQIDTVFYLSAGLGVLFFVIYFIAQKLD